MASISPDGFRQEAATFHAPTTLPPQGVTFAHEAPSTGPTLTCPPLAEPLIPALVPVPDAEPPEASPFTVVDEHAHASATRPLKTDRALVRTSRTLFSYELTMEDRCFGEQDPAKVTPAASERSPMSQASLIATRSTLREEGLGL
jgi:hypothetical protein